MSSNELNGDPMTEDLKSTQNQPDTVLHEDNLPLAKKPSFLYIVSVSIGVFTIIWLAVSAYHGITQ